MTAAPEPVEDGHLPSAIVRLGNAISALVESKPTHVEDHGIVWLDSLYVQLLEELPGRQGTGHGVPRSIPPLCVDAADLLNEIDSAVAVWEPKPVIDLKDDVPPITVIRLHAIEKRGWRPQDVKGIDQIIGAVDGWVAAIRKLLTPPAKWTLPNPCPACNVAVVYRMYAGERVRQPALQVGADGCVCQNCRHAWAPKYFRHLAEVLGYEAIEGVLE